MLPLNLGAGVVSLEMGEIRHRDVTIRIEIDAHAVAADSIARAKVADFKLVIVCKVDQAIEVAVARSYGTGCRTPESAP